MLSRKIEFEKLLNTRDLGGMTGSDGRKIKPGKLYRKPSGRLAFYSCPERGLSPDPDFFCNDSVYRRDPGAV